MKKHILFSLLFVASLTSMPFAGNAEVPLSYYKSIDGKSDEALKTALANLLYPHVNLSYSQLPEYFRDTDRRPDTDYWWDMYSNLDVSIYDRFGSKMNREHCFPKSWWGGSDNVPAYTDINHLYPSEAKANQAKSNLPLGEVVTATFDNDVVKVGYPTTGQGGGAAKVFEPADEYKGDFARTYFYMVTTYQSLTWDTRYMYMLVQNTYPTLKPWAIDLLMRWHREDPVSEKEINRNEQVYRVQSNRNPFIDFPNLAEYIWGDKIGIKFNLDDDHNTTGEPELITPVQGAVVDFNPVAIGQSTSSFLHFKGQNLTGSLSLALIGADKAMFSVEDFSISSSAVNSESGYSLRINYKPTAVGNHTAKLIISDGGLTGSRGVELNASCLDVPALNAINALPATDITSNSYVANWELPDYNVDYFIVTRTHYTNGSSSSEEIIAESNSVLVEGFSQSDSESYNVRAVYLGYESPRSNEIYVDHSGVNSVESDIPFGWAYTPGGIRFVTGETICDVSIYDISGRLILMLPSVENNQELLLPQGAYIITASGVQSTLRVLIRH